MTPPRLHPPFLRPSPWALLGALLIAGWVLRSGARAPAGVAATRPAQQGQPVAAPPPGSRARVETRAPGPGAETPAAASPYRQGAAATRHPRYPHFGQQIELRGVPLEALDLAALSAADTVALYQQTQRAWLELVPELRARLDLRREALLDLRSARDLTDSGACAYVVRVPAPGGGVGYLPIYADPDPRVLELRGLAQELAQGSGMRDHARRRAFEAMGTQLTLAEQDLHVRALADGVDLGVYRPDGTLLASYHQRLPGDP